LDAIRGTVARKAPTLRTLVGLLRAVLPSRLIFGSTYGSTRRAIQRVSHDDEYAAAEQLRMLQDLLESAWKRAPYYRELFETVFDTRSDDWHRLITVNDLNLLPVTGRDLVGENAATMLTVPRKSVDVVATSGSSGKPLSFYLPKSRSSWEWAYVSEVWSRAGWTQRSWRAVLRGSAFPVGVNVVRDVALREMRLSPFRLDNETVTAYLNEIAHADIRYLHGYPSALGVLAAQSLRTGWQHAQKIRGVFPVSESLTISQRALLAKAFPSAAVVPFYGLSEKVAFACEDLEIPNRYHFAPLYGVVDVVDDAGAPVAEGDEGRIVATGLRATAMPFIRYDTGDRGVLVRRGLRCTVDGVRSRWAQEFLYGNRGESVSMTALNLHSSVYSAAQEFRFRQHTTGEADLLVVPAQGSKAEDLEALRVAFQSKMLGVIKIRLVEMESLPKKANGKGTFIEQYLPTVA
jgi:phenylacetate-CoA ligase